MKNRYRFLAAALPLLLAACAPAVRMHGDADGIPEARHIDTSGAAVGVELENRGAVLLFGIRIGVVDVGERSNRHEHLVALLREGDVARPVSTARQLAAGEDDGVPRAQRLTGMVLARHVDDDLR